jgi:membrane protease YdiL (CAAX protease family)
VNRRALRIYFVLAFAITWGAGGLALLARAAGVGGEIAPPNPLICVAGYGPTIAGLIVVGGLEGRRGIARLLARAVPRRAGLPWYLGVIVGYSLIAVLAERLVDPEILTRLPRWDRMLVLLAWTAFLDTGPIGEEFGWRGFALPELLKGHSPLRASVILGVIWAFWHLPAFFIPSLSQSRLFFPLFVLNSISLSIIMTWLYLRTGGDLFLMILVHVAANFTPRLGVSFGPEVAAEIVCAAAVVAAGGLRIAAGPAVRTGDTID